MRLKIIAGNLAIVLLLGSAAYLLVGSMLRAALTREVDAEVRADQALFARSFKLSALEFLDLVAQRSSERQLRDVFAGLDIDSRRTRAYEAAEATAQWLADPARGGRGSPDIAVVVDDTGRALARNGARNVLFGVQLTAQLKGLGRALGSGKPVHDVWLQADDHKLLQTAIAPILSAGGAVLGALIVGFELGNGVAQREAALLRTDVAFVVPGEVYSASLQGGGTRALGSMLFGPHAAHTHQVLGGQLEVSPPWKVRVGDEDFLGVTSRLPMMPSHPVAVALLGSQTARLKMLSALDLIAVLTVLAAILVVLYGALVGNAIVRPIERIEEGILAIINGRTDLRLPTQSAELGGLAFRINQLLNVFTGTAEDAEEDEHGRVSHAPADVDLRDPVFSEGRAPVGSGPPLDEPLDDPTVSELLAQEDEASYVRRLYLEYAAAKAARGEDVSNLPQDRFEQRLAGRATALLRKHGCRMVRFRVETRDAQVILRPVLIR